MWQRQVWRGVRVRSAGRQLRLILALGVLALLALPAVALAAAPVPGSFTGSIPSRPNGLTFYVSADSTHVQDVSIPIDDLKCTGEGNATMLDHLEALEIKIESGAFATTRTEEGRLEGHSVTFKSSFSGVFATNGEEATGTYSEEITFAGSTRVCATGTQSFTAKRDSQPTQTTAAPPAGSYTGSIPGRPNGLTFYVSADSTHLQDVSIPIDDLKCTGEGNATMLDELEALEVPLEAVAGNNASFVHTGAEKGTLEGKPVSIGFTFDGHFHSVNGASVERLAGSYREDITFEGGSTRRCTTNNQSFSATRDSQPTQTTAAPPAGSYTGNLPSRPNGLTFYVSADSTHLQDVSIPTDDLKCTGEGNATMLDELEALEVPLETLAANNASFLYTGAEKGTLEGKPVSIGFTFDGHFHSVNGSSVERAAGTYREDITFEGGSTRRCTTDNQPFSATRDSQPTQTTAAPPAGSYTGNLPSRPNGLTFYVSADSTHLQDVSIPTDDLKCTGEGSATMLDELEALEMPLETLAANNASFLYTATEKGTLENRPVTIKFTFDGHFHSLNSKEVERAAGTYREDITFEGGSTRKCTTDNQPFSATRDSQPTQTTAAPPAGSYTGNVPGRPGGLTLYVSSNGSHVQDVYIPTDDLKCTGEGTATMSDHLEAFEVAAKLTAAGRSFKSAKTEKGAILEGHPVTIKFTFDGHFHSVNEKEVERAAGTYREDITFEGGSTRRCTTNNQWFNATHESQPTQTTAAPPAGNYTGSVPGRPGGLSFEVASNGLHMLNVEIPTDDLKCTGEGATTGSDKLEIAETAIKGKVKFKATVKGKGTISGKGVSFVYTFSGHFHSVNSAEKERVAGTYSEEISFEGSTRRCTTDTQSFSATHT